VRGYVHECRERFGVEPICKALVVSASAYYQRASGPRSARQLVDPTPPLLRVPAPEQK
jgi:hypothetical protein